MGNKLEQLHKAVEEMRKWQEKHKQTRGIKEWKERIKYEKYVDRLLLELYELEHG